MELDIKPDKIIRQRCSGCAFNPGTPANNDRFVKVKIDLCLKAEAPFHCHCNAVEDVIPCGQERICLGFVEALEMQSPRSSEEKAVARELLQLIEDIDAGCDVSIEDMDRVYDLCRDE